MATEPPQVHPKDTRSEAASPTYLILHLHSFHFQDINLKKLKSFIFNPSHLHIMTALEPFQKPGNPSDPDLQNAPDQNLNRDRQIHF